MAELLGDPHPIMYDQYDEWRWDSMQSAWRWLESSRNFHNGDTWVAGVPQYPCNASDLDHYISRIIIGSHSKEAHK